MNEIRKQNTLLSICIPTYNRCHALSKTIESIVCQKEFTEGKVEIVISDNASTDDTEIICRQYSEKYVNFIYYQNIDNIRDRNFPLALSRGNGLLRKLNNDTLTYLPGSLKKICESIENYRMSKPHLYFSNRTIDSNNECVSHSFRDFIIRESYSITWIGSFSLWEDECSDISNETDGCELCLWQVRKLLEVTSKKNNIITLDFPFGKNQKVDKKNLDYGLYQIFYINFFKLISPYIKENYLSIEDKNDIEKDLLYTFFTPWIIAWDLRNSKFEFNEKENLKQAINNVYTKKTYWNEYRKFYQRKYIIQKIKKVILWPLSKLLRLFKKMSKR